MNEIGRHEHIYLQKRFDMQNKRAERKIVAEGSCGIWFSLTTQAANSAFGSAMVCSNKVFEQTLWNQISFAEAI